MRFSFLKFIRLAIALSLALYAPTAVMACSSCGCTLNTNWDSQGYATHSGFRLDLRYDDINQSQLRTGKEKVDMGAIAYPADREIQQKTHNHNVTMGLDYSSDKSWGVNVEVPFIDRTHTTIVDGDTDVSASRTSHIGDVRVAGRYQGFLSGKNLGVQVGLKLPTGPYKDVFRDGPQAGELLDRGLQAGTGTTDLLLSVYHFYNFKHDWGYFSQASFQKPFAAREDFKPGTTWLVSTGLRYTRFEKFAPQIQISEKTELKESGDQSDRANSGSSVVSVAPGVTFNLLRDLHLYGFVQLPVYQNLNGYQLVPKATFSVGVRYAI